MTRQEPRLALKPAGAAIGSVDGGWWPQSLDPATAFPELVSAPRPRTGPVGRVDYDPAIGTNTRRVSLLVVPPHTPGGVARAVLRSAAAANSTATGADILAGNGVPPQDGSGAPAEPSRTDQVPEHRWEAEGGHIRHADRRAATSPTSTR